eukprot:TRINITY_DN564_c0_g1_i2.p4 TRINITY_DN564_c0_g1~~TRINITY_DN564_c0_g1_i2.p4  ORF type:complete len:120 (-),score=29.47 TRINITY_DN564_c0_g1_i2:358-717(-)
MVVCLIPIVQLSNCPTVIGMVELGNEIGDDGVTAIALSLVPLGENKTLQKISLSGNVISDSGVESLMRILGADSSLRHIDLERNRVSDDGAMKVIVGLENNPTIISLSLSGLQHLTFGI